MNATSPAPILVVDDDTAQLRELEKALGGEHRVVSFTSPRLALEAIQREPLAVIVSDHVMPGMNGVDLLREAHLVAPNTGRILITDEATLQLSLEVANQARVTKMFERPFSVRLLRAEVDECVRRYASFAALDTTVNLMKQTGAHRLPKPGKLVTGPIVPFRSASGTRPAVSTLPPVGSAPPPSASGLPTSKKPSS